AQEREIDAPADVLLAYAEALAPPGVLIRHVASHRAEAVDPTARQPARELLALLGEKAAGLPVLLRAREVDLARGGVEVAHHDDRLARSLRRVERAVEPAVKPQLEGHAAVVAVGAAPVREVAIDDGEPTDARDLHAPLAIHRADPERGLDPIGRAPRVEADPAVALALGAHPVRVTACRPPQRLGHLVAAAPRLLNADHVGTAGLEEAREALLRDGPHPVHVPGDDPHSAVLTGRWMVRARVERKRRGGRLRPQRGAGATTRPRARAR